MTKRVIGRDQEDSLAAIGTATVKIAHEIANSLHVVGASVDLLRQLLHQQPQTIDSRILAVCRELALEVERMKEMLDELRDVSRPPALTIEPVSLHDLVAGILRDGRVAGWSASIGIEQQIPADLPLAMADREKLARVLLNLCVNAFEAMPHGGKLALRAYRTDELVCLEVEDTGVGIPEDFDPFRAFNTTKKNGWGLGLAVVKEAVQALNGTLSYASRPGEGTTFRVCLPAAA